jgi:hypothetical protein
MHYPRPLSIHRADVQRLLIRAGWTRHADGSLSRAGVVWRNVGNRRDSILRLFEGHPDFVVEFSPEIPASVIAAACIAAAEFYGRRAVAA